MGRRVMTLFFSFVLSSFPARWTVDILLLLFIECPLFYYRDYNWRNFLLIYRNGYA